MDWALDDRGGADRRCRGLKRLSGSPITPAILFVSIRLLVGPKVLDGIDISSTSSTVRALAEATLALVLFSDASRIDFGKLRREISVPLRLLGIGLPLTIALGALAAGDLRRVDGLGSRHPRGRPGADRRRPRPGGGHRERASRVRIRQGLNIGERAQRRDLRAAAVCSRRRRRRRIAHLARPKRITLCSRRSGTGSSEGSSPGC